jgi:HEAT repeat protein
VPPLLLYHDSALVRRAVLRLIAEAERRDALPLVERCLSDPDPGVRSGAVTTLARLRGTDASSLMRPHLTAADPGLVSAAILSVWNEPDPDTREQARSALARLMADERVEARVEVAKALGRTDLTEHAQALLLLLTDRDRRVVREAVSAVRRRARRGGGDPIFAPSLVSLLDDRRLKRDARRALEAFGESIIPQLLHFMNSPDERPWVRRALPKTVALIGGPRAVAGLASALTQATDPFLLRKLIEGLASAKADGGDLAGHERAIVEAVAGQSAGYFRALATLVGLGSLERGRLSGPLLAWDAERHQPSLLEQLLAERMCDSVRNAFELLALIHNPRHVRDAHRSVTSGQPGLVATAAEYLDNVLEPSVKRYVRPVVEDQPLTERLAWAGRLFGVCSGPRDELLARLVDGCLRREEDGYGWGAAALYEVYATRTERLYPNVARVHASHARDPLTRETAAWVCARIGLAAAGQREG